MIAFPYIQSTTLLSIHSMVVPSVHWGRRSQSASCHRPPFEVMDKLTNQVLFYTNKERRISIGKPKDTTKLHESLQRSPHSPVAEQPKSLPQWTLNLAFLLFIPNQLPEERQARLLFKRIVLGTAGLDLLWRRAKESRVDHKNSPPAG